MSILNTTPFYAPVVDWNVNGTSYDSISKNIGAAVVTPTHLWFDPNGNYFFISDGFDNDAWRNVYRFDMSTPWDITSAPSTPSQEVDVISIAGGDPVIGVAMSIDGNHLFHGINTNPGEIHHWTLGTPWDLTTAVYASGMSAGPFGTSLQDISINGDGTIIIATVGVSNTSYSKWILSTPYDLTTAGVAVTSAAATQSAGIHFNDDGTQYLTVLGQVSPYPVRQYKLSTGFDWSGGLPAVASESLNTVNIQSTGMNDVFIKPDATKMWLLSKTAKVIYQYSL